MADRQPFVDPFEILTNEARKPFVDPFDTGAIAPNVQKPDTGLIPPYDPMDAEAGVLPRRSIFASTATLPEQAQAPSRGVVGDVLSVIPRAAVTTVGRYARAARHGESPEETPTLSKISDWAEKTVEESSFLKPSKEMESSALRRGIIEPIESV
ncbi:MAG: hypothetical protein C4586_08230, partial [Anaerolineaceae bacterium]